MSKNLIKAGYELVVYDVVPALADAVASDSAARGTSCRDVAARSPIVITMLPDGPDVEQTVLGPDGVLEGAAAHRAIHRMLGRDAGGTLIRSARSCRGQS
jgi:2-hydroxy-3-oxopropionate reductase